MKLSKSQSSLLGKFSRWPHKVVNPVTGEWQPAAVKQLDKMGDVLLGLTRRGRPPASAPKPEYTVKAHPTAHWRTQLPISRYVESISGTAHDQKLPPLPDLNFHPKPEPLTDASRKYGRVRIANSSEPRSTSFEVELDEDIRRLSDEDYFDDYNSYDYDAEAWDLEENPT